MNNFFKHNDKVYSENLNDSVLVGNAFSWSISISLPTDSDGLFPSSSDVVKAKVADVYATPNTNLSIGSTIENSSGSSQVYRLTVYPNFNRFGGFTFVSLEGDGSVIITEKGGTNPVRNNLDYANLGNVTELKTLREYDLVVTIPAGGVVTGLGFGFKSSSADVTASISQGNVTGLESSLDGLDSAITTGLSGKVDKVTGKQLSTNDFDNTYKEYVDIYTECSEEHITYWGNMGYSDGLPNNPLVIEKVGRVMHLHGTWKTSSSISIRSQASKKLGLFSSPAPNYPIHSSQLLTNGGLYEIMVSPDQKIELTNVSKSSDLTIPADKICYVNVMWILDY